VPSSGRRSLNNTQNTDSIRLDYYTAALSASLNEFYFQGSCLQVAQTSTAHVKGVRLAHSFCPWNWRPSTTQYNSSHRTTVAIWTLRCDKFHFIQEVPNSNIFLEIKFIKGIFVNEQQEEGVGRDDVCVYWERETGAAVHYQRLSNWRLTDRSGRSRWPQWSTWAMSSE